MRRFVAIVLLFVFLLYHIGYYGFYLITSYQLDNHWHVKTYQDKLEEEVLLHAAIPLAVPYQSNQTEYVPASGKVEVDGNFYRLVRQRYANDTLHVIYVPDILQKELQQSVDKWLSTIIPIPQSDADSQHLWISLTKSFLIHKTLQLDEPVRLISIQKYGYVALNEYEFISVIFSPPPQQA